MKIKSKLTILLILFPFIVLSEEKYFPYFFNVVNNTVSPVIVNPVTTGNVADCLFWYDYWYYNSSNKVKVATDYCIEHPTDTLPNISAQDYQSAAQAAIAAWNAIVSDINTKMYIEDNSSYYVVHIVTWDQWDENNYDLSESGFTLHAVTLEEEEPDIYGITYYNSNYQSEPGWEYTIIYLNADPDATFNWVFKEYPSSGEVDVQHIMTHELGHVLGYADDTDPNDEFETLMTQGQGYWSRCVEQELRNSFEILYDIETTSPILNILESKEDNNEIIPQ